MTQNMILRCCPTVSAILRRHTKSCLLCFFNNPLFNSQNFLFTCNTTIPIPLYKVPMYTLASLRASVAIFSSSLSYNNVCARCLSSRMHSPGNSFFFCQSSAGSPLSLLLLSLLPTEIKVIHNNIMHSCSRLTKMD